MTIAKAIEAFDREYRNTIPKMLKTYWLTTLDRTVFEDIIATHAPSASDTQPSFLPDDYTDTTVLLIPDSHANVYLRFLSMKADLYHSDVARDNNDSILFFTAYDEYEKHYNRTNMPLKRVKSFNI